MPAPCQVCAHKQRAAIDEAVSFHVVNVASVARSFGVHPKALRRHRDKHLPLFLPAFQAASDALTLGALQAEARRLYMVTLDALAAAEAGVLVDIDNEGKPMRQVSHTAVARFIREARQGLDLLAKLSSDAADTGERPTGVTNGELDARLSAALSEVMRRAVDARSAGSVSTAPTVAPQPGLPNPQLEVEGCAADGDREGGSHVGQTGAALPPPQLPEISVTPSPLPQDKSDIAAQRVDPSVPPLVKHPLWVGSPAASPEERRAEGYADIPVEEHTTPSSALLLEQVRLERERQLARIHLPPG